ncbi:hypothetical protein FRC07_001580 [Ceratobasidium sp. 392]|nr:hypothetical protein FRC07_001580 [Ceratobasidium sp. 392]
MDETDVGLNELSHVQPTQAYSRASRFLTPNNQALHWQAIRMKHLQRAPMAFELKSRSQKFLKLTRRKLCGCHSAPTIKSSSRSRAVMRAGTLAPDQQVVIGRMEYHVHKDIVCAHPWPEDQDEFLENAKEYSIDLTRILGPNIFTPRFTDTDPNHSFCVGALGAALIVILFKSSKVLALVFMKSSAHPTIPRNALTGIMYWALKKMYLSLNLHFDEQHFRSVWEHYFQILIKLPHLGQLRIDLLDQLKEYYPDHWPAEERDDDNDSLLAW